MIKIEKVNVVGFEEAIRGMRNPMNSWDKSDSERCGSGACDLCIDYDNCPYDHNSEKFIIGDNDFDLMMKLAEGGPVHAKYRRMIGVYLDITAPLYWWKEFDTYKVGTVANSCSTMHKIQAKEFTFEDFSCEHMDKFSLACLEMTIQNLNSNRDYYNETKDKHYWWQMIQLLPSSYNQKRTIFLNYEVLVGIWKHRKLHKLDEWRELCKWILTLPCREVITGYSTEGLEV